MSQGDRTMGTRISVATRCVFAIAIAFAIAGCKPRSETTAEPQAETAKSQSSAKAEAPAQATVAAKESLCADGERAIFSCALEGGEKIVSMCASADASETAGYVYYAYGAKGAPEFVYPKTRTHSMSDFKRTHLMFAGNTGGYAYTFDAEGRTYEIYSVSGSSGLEKQGLAVFEGDFAKPLRVSECEPDTVFDSDDESLIDLTLKWKTDSRIENSGIPESNP